MMTTFDSITRPAAERPAADPQPERWGGSVAVPPFEYDVAVVGLGYVGLPTALAYHAAGCRVLALDASGRRLDVIRSDRADLLAADHERLRTALTDPRFALSDDPQRLRSAAAVIVCVPTPIDEHLVPELSPLRAACATVVETAMPGQTLMLTSTTYVGCTEDLLVRPLAERGFTVGTDVFVAFSAERIDPGNAAFGHEEVPRVVGGATPQCEEEASRLLLHSVAAVHRVRSLAAAEMTKLLENTFRAVNIALANEFADICSELDLNVTDVITAAATKPYGFMPFYPGPGVGGHCIPCDPHYLLWQLRRSRVAAPVITQAMSAIAARPHRVVDRAQELLSDAGRGLHGARVIVVGIAYKPDVADLRESPALEILAALRERGAEVAYLDPHFDVVGLPDGSTLIGLTAEQAIAFDAELVVLHTRHSDAALAWIDPDLLVLDTTYRGVAGLTQVNL